MRYFGERSLSSWISRILPVSWYVVLILFLALSGFLMLSLFSISFGDPFTTEIAKGQYCAMGMGESDPDWVELTNMPNSSKLLVFPYITAITILLLMIIRKSQRLFVNFRKNIIFSRDNALTTSAASKLLIAFSVLTFNFTTLLVSLMLLMLCGIFKSGTALQEEQDLTV